MRWKIKSTITDRYYGSCNFDTHEIDLNLRVVDDLSRASAALYHEGVHAIHGPDPTEKGHQNIVELANILNSINGIRNRYNIKLPASIQITEGNQYLRYDPLGPYRTEAELWRAVIRREAYIHKIPVTERSLDSYIKLLFLDISQIMKNFKQGKVELGYLDIQEV